MVTPTPERIAALAEALHTWVRPSHLAVTFDDWDEEEDGSAPQCDGPEPHLDDAAGILAALPDWLLLPTGEVERLRAIEEAARAVCDSPCHTPELEPTVVFDALRLTLAGDAP